MLISANVPANVFSRGFTTLGRDVKPVTDYIEGGGLQADLGAHTGIYLFGSKACRADAFAMIAKFMTLNGIGVYYTNLHNLVGVLDHDAERKQTVERVAHLFVDDFQKTYRGPSKEHCPYTLSSRAEVEELLRFRKAEGRTTHLSASVPFSDLLWWSDDFAISYEEHLTKIAI